MCESTNESYNMGVRYQTIRKRLDSLGYRQALSLDALPLTEKLLADLIQTTESLKHFKAIAENNIENYRHTSLSIDPYNYDNTKLVDENNQLHAQLLEIKENNLKQNKILQRKIQRLENDCSELQLASSKNLKKIKDLELESSNKSKRIQELLGKCCKPTISNVGLAAKKRSVYPLRRPVLECDPLPIDNSNRDFQYPNLTKVKPEIIDLVAMADRKISSLNREVIKLKDELSLQTDDMDTLRTQLSMKEKEINRLRKMQDSGRSYSAAIKKCSCRKNVSNCGQCNFISCRTPGDCSQSVCNKMADISEIKILQQAKLNLEQQLRDALDKQHDAMSQAMKLAERNEELEKELRDIDHVALAVEADCSSTVKQNNKRIVQLQEKLQNTTMKMHELENDLLVEKRMSQELRADLEGCKLENRNIQRTLDRACDEKEYLTKRIEELTMIASNDRKNSISTSTDNKINTNTKSFDDAANNSLKKMTDESKKLIEQLERDRDYYKDQWNKLNEQTNKTSDTENAELWSQICDLKHQLNENKTQVSELQREKRDLCREKFDLENQIQMFKSHNRNPCSHCTTCRSMSGCVCPSSAPTSGDSGIGSKLALTRLERERDSARADVERLMEERDLLHERLKGSRQAALCGLEEQVRDAKNELRITKQELATQRTQYFQLRALQDQTDQALGDVQSQLIQSENELSKALERNKNLDEQQLQLDNQIIELKQTINTFHLNMADLDRENDKLRMELDEKTVCIAALEEEVKIKAQQTLNADNQLRDLHQKNQMYIDRAAEQERQLRNMQMEIENYQRKLNEMFADFERVGQENKRLQNDLTAVTCDSRSLQHELDESRAESQDLKRQLKTYVSEVHRVQELLNKKENERAEMLGHFRSLSLEAQDLENSNQNLECKAAEANGALQTARSRAIELEGQLTDKKCQIRSYEVQIAELTSRIANLESQVHQQKEYRAGIEADLNSLRDHCMKVDNEKHSLQNDFDNITDMNRRYENNLAQLKVEQKILNDQRNRDHAKIEHLEKLIDQEKRKSIDLHRVNQELKNEIGRLKERVTDLQRQLSAESAELRSYQTQAAEYNQQITKLRREVTDEKFNRAQKEEEHRRTIHYTTDTSTIPFEFNSGEPVRSTAPVVTFDSINSTDEMPHGVIRYSNNS